MMSERVGTSFIYIFYSYRMFSTVGGRDLAEWLERLTANAVVATVLGSIPGSSDTVDSEGRQMKQCRIKLKKKILLLDSDPVFSVRICIRIPSAEPK
jgi:hypothetical protein